MKRENVRMLLVQWDSISSEVENPTFARTALGRALTSLVPNGAPAAAFPSDGPIPLIAAITDRRLLLLHASAPGRAPESVDPVAECGRSLWARAPGSP